MSDFGVAKIFTDNCVLQRNKPVRIWGTGTDGKRVTAGIDGNESQTIVIDGEWELVLSPMEAGVGKTLVISDGTDEFFFNDVAIGEVWIAGGQSNMEYELQNCTEGKTMMAEDKPNVRFYYTPKYEYESPKFADKISEAHWETFDEEGKARWSAVGYIFAKELSEALGVTVGIIGCNWGGTSASAWMAESDIRGDEVLKVYYEDYDKNTEGMSFEEQEKIYEDYLSFRNWWEPECAKMYEANPNTDWADVIKILGDPQYPGPINGCNPMRPAGLYTTMLSKVIRYTMAGAIYYQGESDDHRPQMYDRLFTKLIERWRTDNGDENLPFMAVSLPMHKYSQDPDFKNWPIIRLNQRKVAREMDNVGLAVCTDLGEYNEIHPHDKRQVSHRLFLQAMWLVYGKMDEEEANGPAVSTVSVTDDNTTVYFKHVGGGLIVKGELSGFEVSFGTSEEDFVSVKGVAEGNKVVLDTSGPVRPRQIRYLWTNYSEVTLFGGNGICAEPFTMSLE